ncbi:MAG TPA: 2Fe-2S iron-sulfur cluster-binding protein, partial [Xanthobacteraceae bacterium]
MRQPFRTSSGGRIDRSRPISFRFDGRELFGFTGDTLASALIANGVHLVGRSFKYHRPRGIVSAGSEEPNALVCVQKGGGRSTPNLRATQVELYEGLCASSQNRWPSLAFDIGAATDRFAALVPAGFYYKTFMGPRSLGLLPWKRLFEPAIRRAAGLGRAPRMPDLDRYAHRFAHCDVLVVGAGPAGLAAATAAAATGACVILCDEQAELGGSLLSETRELIDGKPAQGWVAESIATLRRHNAVTLLLRTQCFGYFSDNLLALAQSLSDHLPPSYDATLARERLWQVRAKEVVLATGAIERPLVFSNNDRPGIMLASAARTYAMRYGARAGTRAVIAAADDSAYVTARELKEAGIEIALIADLRRDPDNKLVVEAEANGMRVDPAAAVLDTRGRLRVQEVTIGHIGGDGNIRSRQKLEADLVLMTGGWTPSVHLFSQSRGTLKFDPALAAYIPDCSAERERSAGACRGIYALSDVVADGYAAGAQAAQRAGFSSSVTLSTRPSPRANARAQVPATAARKAFVDFQNDVTTNDLKLAEREGFR